MIYKLFFCWVIIITNFAYGQAPTKACDDKSIFLFVNPENQILLEYNSETESYSVPEYYCFTTLKQMIDSFANPADISYGTLWLAGEFNFEEGNLCHKKLESYYVIPFKEYKNKNETSKVERFKLLSIAELSNKIISPSTKMIINRIIKFPNVTWKATFDETCSSDIKSKPTLKIIQPFHKSNK